MLPHFIAHYRAMFAGCKIVVYDNMSTDRTVAIAKEMGCEVRVNDSNGQICENNYLRIKNHCWKGDAGWVIIADCDELLNISAAQLLHEEAQGTTLIASKAYNMVGFDSEAITDIYRGVRAMQYDKVYCFDARAIKEINYSPGAHKCKPVGQLKLSEVPYLARHYRWIDPDYLVARHAAFKRRLSANNKAKNWGHQYTLEAQQIRENFEQARNQAIPIL
jgi:glycosyltransferase involved in cell wall biosynthesis